MRELKFRVWIIEAKRMGKVFNITFMPDEDTPRVFERFENRNYPVEGQCYLMQCTGIKDKNGVEIYEGDFIKDEYDDVFREVKWNEKDAGLEVSYGDDDTFIWEYINKNCEVVGNIYEDLKK